ncbi:MAG: helix-turn-helix domain-containing protein, partial [bacterium]|nr:helix-turn-helix domain-containing protein [bacterium]
KETRHRYGTYQNVLLSDAEMETVKREFPSDYMARIERMSEYIASTGKGYKNYLAALRSWARREKPKYSAAAYQFEEGDSL